MTTETIDEKIKELIAKPENRIKIHDLVHEETEKLRALTATMELPAQNGAAVAALKVWIKEIEKESEILVKLFAYGCYFGSEDQAYLWKKSVERLAGKQDVDSLKGKMQLYPLMLALYAGGISSVAAGKSANLKSLLTSQIYYEYHKLSDPLVYVVNGWLISTDQANQLFETGNHKTPLSDQVYDVLKELYPKSLLSEDELEKTFDRWDIMLCMTVAFHTMDGTGSNWTPTGRFSWNNKSQLDAIKLELTTEKSSWPLIRLGMFNSDINEAEAALEVVKNTARSRF